MDYALLAARNVTVLRGGVCIVDRASVSVAAASVLTIRGASGSGKSTFLRAIATLIPISGGEVQLEGREVHEVGIPEYRRRVAYVSQLPAMFEGSVGFNVGTGPRFRGVALSKSDVERLLERVGLGAELAGRAASELSGGERLRVGLARALANEPRVLLLDEPTASLDPEAASVILDLVLALAKSGTAILAVTHSAEHAARLEGTRYQMTAGVLSSDGASS